MATRLGDAAFEEPAWGTSGASGDVGAPRAPQVSTLSRHDNPLRGNGAKEVQAALARGTVNPLAAAGGAAAPPAAPTAGRASRIAAAKRKTDTGVFTWRRVAMAAGALGLCAVVAVVAYVSTGADSSSSSGGGAGSSSGAAGANSGAASGATGGGQAGTTDVSLPGGAGSGSEGNGGGLEGPLGRDGSGMTTDEITAHVNSIMNPRLLDLQGQVNDLNADLQTAKADLDAAEAALVTTQTDLTATKADLDAAQAALAAAQADLDAAEAALDAKADATAVAALTDTVAAKADAADLAGKADAAVVTALTDTVAAKADAADLAGKADAAAVTALTADLAGKADAADLAGKADAADLAGKADAADLTAGLADAAHWVSTSEARTNSTLWAHSQRLQAGEDSLDTLETDVSGDVAALDARLNAINVDNPLLVNASSEVTRLKYMLGRIGLVGVVSAEMREQRLRQVGNSGIHGARMTFHGSEPWFDASHVSSGRSIMSIHDHANLRDTVGMGEISAALNGVEFWTRHNDYRLRTPDPANTGYKTLKDIEYPDVPPSVLACTTNVTCQVEEMRAYFNAWTRQDSSIRDYKDYFQSLVCYLEGWWESDGDLVDPFSSDRHTIEASDWDDLYRKYRYLAMLGRKNSRENIPFLPTRLWEMKDGLEPIVARWTYRIACQPLNMDVELQRLRITPDLHVQMQNTRPYNLGQVGSTRAARFEVNGYIGTNANSIRNRRYGTQAREYMDTIMEQVSGLNSHRVMSPPLLERVLDAPGVNESAYPYTPSTPTTELDMTHYNRYYRTALAGAMGTTTRRRGWQDRNLFVSHTTHDRVAALALDYEPTRATYAIPLELIYTTPLTNWNPYGFPYSSTNAAPAAGGRNGDKVNPDRAYLGSSRQYFYRTPAEFFNGFGESDAADTSAAVVGVVHPDTPTVVRQCVASGHWIFFPVIAGVSQHFPYVGARVRQRYPIAPVHVSTGVVWQEVKALQAIVATGDAAQINGDVNIPLLNERRLQMGASISGGEHTHYIYLNEGDLNALTAGGTVTKTSATGNMHAHQVELRLVSGSTTQYEIVNCDDSGTPNCLHPHVGLTLSS